MKNSALGNERPFYFVTTQQALPCRRPGQPAAAAPISRNSLKGLGGKTAKTGNVSSLFPEMNADTDVPKDYAAGGPAQQLTRPEFDWAKICPRARVWGDARAIAGRQGWQQCLGRGSLRPE